MVARKESVKRKLILDLDLYLKSKYQHGTEQSMIVKSIFVGWVGVTQEELVRTVMLSRRLVFDLNFYPD